MDYKRLVIEFTLQNYEFLDILKMFASQWKIMLISFWVYLEIPQNPFLLLVL